MQSPREFRKALELAAFGRDWLSPEQAEKVEALATDFAHSCGRYTAKAWQEREDIMNAELEAAGFDGGVENSVRSLLLQKAEHEKALAQAREAGRREGLELAMLRVLNKRAASADPMSHARNLALEGAAAAIRALGGAEAGEKRCERLVPRGVPELNDDVCGKPLPCPEHGAER